jgi:ParB/RepB/Spo0J family partition protein
LPIARLRESRSQPRKTYNPVKLQELAESIKAQGVMQPIVVRQLPEDSALRFESASSCALVFDYEIVFGHRRSRAAALAGLEFIPTFIRDMDDEQVALAQIHENLERDDVHQIEEADAFMTLMDQHHVTSDQLIAQTGKSRSYIYGQIKMARKLGSEVREACLANVIGSEIALLIARYCPSHKLQPKALEAVMVKKWDGSEMITSAMSARTAKNRLRQDFCIHIDAAPFDRGSRDLVVDASACGTCPKLAANDPELADELDADVCTDADCYRGKCRAHLDSKIAEVRAAGRTVIDGEDALKLLPGIWSTRPVGYVLTSDVAVCDESNNGEELSEISFAEALVKLGDQAQAPVYIAHPHAPGVLVECLPREPADTVTDALVASTGTTATRKASTQDTGGTPPTRRRGVSRQPVRSRAAVPSTSRCDRAGGV